MKNSYLDKNDIGFIIIYILALIGLLIYAISIWFEAPGYDKNVGVSITTKAAVTTGQTDKNSSPAISINKKDSVLTNENENTVEEITSNELENNSFQGESIAKTNCYTCHKDGLLNAPRAGVREEWQPRLEKGFDSLYSHALNGFNSMPSRGGNPNLKDNEIEQAILFMLEQSNLSVPGKEIPATTSTSDETVSKPELDSVSSKQKNSQIKNKDDAIAKANKTPDQTVKTTFVIIDEEPETPTIQKELPGKEIYNSNCASCHDDGSDNAPKLGVQEEWIPLFSKGVDKLSRNIKQDKSSHSDLKQAEVDNLKISQAINYIMQQTFWPNNN